MKENFVFTDENLNLIRAHQKQYPKGREQSSLLVALDLAQRQCGGWLPAPVFPVIADLFSMPELHVIEVASFYTLFHLKPVGAYHIQVCRTTPCWLRGSDALVEMLSETLRIEPGTVTSDGKFSWCKVECLGACTRGPVAQINDTYHEDLTPHSLLAFLETCGPFKGSSNA